MSKWREVRLGKVVEFNPRVKLEKNKEYSFIGIADINANSNFVSETSIEKYTGQSSSKFENGDILFSRITPCLENRKIARAILKSSDKGFGSTEFFVFRGKKDVTRTDFIHYLVSSDIVVLPAINSMTGASGRQRADKDFVSKIKIKIPDLETQEKIADILSTYDKLIENNNKRIKILEETAEETYKEWFVRMRFPGHKNTKFEKGIPKGWEVKKVEQLVKRLETGHFYKEDELEDEGKVIVIDQSEKEYLGYHNGEPTHRPSIENPIILFGDHSCKMIIMIGDFSLAENVIPFKSNSESPELFLYYSLKGLIKTQEYKRHWKELTSKKILYPEIDLQIKFANMMKDNILAVEKLKVVNQNLIKQRDLLLPRLMNGTIQVK